MPKSLLKSKTFWSGAVIIAVGVANYFGYLSPEMLSLLITGAGGFGFIGLRDFLKTLEED